MQNLANCLYATVNKRDKVTVVGNQLLVISFFLANNAANLIVFLLICPFGFDRCQ